MPPVQRSDSSSTLTFTTVNNPIIIAGIIIIVLIFCGVFSWLGFRLYKKRTSESKMGVSFLSVKGVVPDRPGAEKGANQSVYFLIVIQMTLIIILHFSKVEQRVFETYGRLCCHST